MKRGMPSSFSTIRSHLELERVCYLSKSAHNTGQNEQKNIWVEIQDRSVSMSCLTKKIAEVDVKGITFPSKGKLYIHLRDPSGMQIDSGTHSIQMRGEMSER
jgi:hypothetical protein